MDFDPPPASAPPSHLTMQHVWAKLSHLDQQMSRLVEALLGGLDGKGGALGRLRHLEEITEDQDVRLVKVEAKLVALEARATATEALPGTRAVALVDWARLAVGGIILSGVAGVVGAHLSK